MHELPTARIKYNSIKLNKTKIKKALQFNQTSEFLIIYFEWGAGWWQSEESFQCLELYVLEIALT